MNEYSEQKVLSSEDKKKFLGLKSLAYKEYLAARHLMNDGFFQQSAFFMNTSIEKELKAFLFALNITVKIKHDTFKLLNLLKKYKPLITEKINPEFMKALTKIYASRYFENLGAGYNFVMIKNKFLAELDYTYSVLEPTTKAIHIPEHNQPLTAPGTTYEHDKINKNPILFKNNYQLNEMSKEQFLNKEDLVFEFRIGSKLNLMEVVYTIPMNNEHDRFLYEALKPTDSSNSYTISHISPNNTRIENVIQDNSILRQRDKND